MHVELDGLGLFLILEVVVSQEVVQLSHHWRREISAFREGWHLATKRNTSGTRLWFRDRGSFWLGGEGCPDHLLGSWPSGGPERAKRRESNRQLLSKGGLTPPVRQWAFLSLYARIISTGSLPQ